MKILLVMLMAQGLPVVPQVFVELPESSLGISEDFSQDLFDRYNTWMENEWEGLELVKASNLQVLLALKCTDAVSEGKVWTRGTFYGVVCNLRLSLDMYFEDSPFEWEREKPWLERSSGEFWVSTLFLWSRETSFFVGDLTPDTVLEAMAGWLDEPKRAWESQPARVQECWRGLAVGDWKAALTPGADDVPVKKSGHTLEELTEMGVSKYFLGPCSP